MSLLQNSNAISAAGGYNIERSLRFRSSAAARLSRTFATPTNTSTWTLSAWIKRGDLAPTTASTVFASRPSGTTTAIYFNSTGNLVFWNNEAVAATSTAIFRDPSAWYHLVVSSNGTTTTAYINNSSILSWTGDLALINNSGTHYIGHAATTGARDFDGYMTDINFVDGQELTPSSFGETDTTTGVWKPKDYTGTYGINGFHLNFSDNSALTTISNAGLGKDFSGNGNYWTTTNISITSGTTYDSMTDVPTLTSATAANYCVLNPISTITTATLSNANIAFTTATTGHNAIGSMGMSSGKYYWEAQTSAGTTQARATVYGTAASTYYSFAANTTDYGFRFDADAGTLDYTTNGSSWTSLATGLTSGPYFPFFNNNGTTSKTISVNFGQRPFTYTPPTGYTALNTFNLPDSTIKKGNSYMDATLWTGTGSGITITNAGGFKPDLVWYKQRNGTRNHLLFNSVSGTTKYLQSNSTNAETTDAQSLTSFNSNGFTLGTNSNGATNGETYVAWQWQAGQGSTSNITVNQYGSTPSIASTVSVNTTTGFSIITYSGNGTAGATIGHGLGVAPRMIFVKPRNAIDNWAVYHSSTGATNYLQLNTQNASAASTTLWNDTSPTSTVFSVGTNNDVNDSARTYVAYCWAEIAGFSAFGSYTGNGSTNGPFVYLGFRPKFILFKNTSTTSNWVIEDSGRNTYNVVTSILIAESNVAETTGTTTSSITDFLSNGFKLRGTGGTANGNGNTIIYAAFAENPFKNSLAR
jgi:hypothetical protein